MISSSTYEASIEGNTIELERLKEEVLKLGEVKKLYLLGLTTNHSRTETLFTAGSASLILTGHYYLLVLIEKSVENKLSETQDKIENNLQHFIPSTVIVIYLEEFTEWLLHGHVFANTVCEKATLLYEEEGPPLPLPAPVNEEEKQKENDLLFRQTITKVESFLSGAELYRLRKEYSLSAFMLHQAAEQSLRAMLMIGIGLRVITHNIDKMLRYASMFTPGAAAVFSTKGKPRHHLVKLLSDAYLGSRYKNDYHITADELTALTEKVKTIKALFENTTPQTDRNK